jgi:WD40 repeat protein
MPKIAISYRRADSEAMTGRIFDRLASHYGRDVIFRDIDSIPPGIDFRVHINEMLRQTGILLAVVGPGWVGATDGGGSRILQESDAVRVEIETALRRRTPLIPILIGSTTMPSTEQLPPSLKDFAFRNALRVDTGQDFDYHIERLIKSIDGILSQHPKPPPSGETKIPSGASRSDTGSRQAAALLDMPGRKDTGSRAAVATPSSETTSKERLSIAAVVPKVSPGALWPADRQGQVVRLAVIAGAAALVVLGVLFAVFGRGSGAGHGRLLSLTGHTSPVSSVAFSPNSELIAAGSSDKSVMIWDAASGLLRHNLTGESEAVYSIAFEPNGKRIVSGGKDGIIVIRDIDSGQRVGRPLRPEMTYGWDVLPAVLSLAISPDGTRIAAGNADGSVKIWDVASGTVRHVLNGHSDAVTSVAYSRDGASVVSGSVDGTVRLWNGNTGEALGTIRSPSGQILAVAISPDGKEIATGGSGGTVVIWNSKLLQVQMLLTQLSSVNALAFAKDGWHLAVGGADTNVQIWDAAGGRLEHSLSGHAGGIRALAYSPDGRRLASGSDDTTVGIWPAD